jgi:hypothetical protein
VYMEDVDIPGRFEDGFAMRFFSLFSCSIEYPPLHPFPFCSSLFLFPRVREFGEGVRCLYHGELQFTSHHIDGVCEQYVQQRRDELMEYDNGYIGYKVRWLSDWLM